MLDLLVLLRPGLRHPPRSDLDLDLDLHGLDVVGPAGDGRGSLSRRVRRHGPGRRGPGRRDRDLRGPRRPMPAGPGPRRCAAVGRSRPPAGPALRAVPAPPARVERRASRTRARWPAGLSVGAPSSSCAPDAFRRPVGPRRRGRSGRAHRSCRPRRPRRSSRMPQRLAGRRRRHQPVVGPVGASVARHGHRRRHTRARRAHGDRREDGDEAPTAPAAAAGRATERVVRVPCDRAEQEGDRLAPGVRPRPEPVEEQLVGDRAGNGVEALMPRHRPRGRRAANGAWRAPGAAPPAPRPGVIPRAAAVSSVENPTATRRVMISRCWAGSRSIRANARPASSRRTAVASGPRAGSTPSGSVADRRGGAHRGPLGVGELASGDRVDEGLEGQAAVLVGRQGRQYRHAHLLGHVLRGVLGAEAPEPGTGIPDRHVADPPQQHVPSVVGGAGQLHEVTQGRGRVHPLHRRRATVRYTGAREPSRCHRDLDPRILGLTRAPRWHLADGSTTGSA